jgi:uncharacterized RDD family membrane protein YckC
MALITCPDCTGTLSSSARSCPHCGRPGPFAEAPGWTQPAAPAYPETAAPPARYEYAPEPAYASAPQPHGSVAYAPAPPAEREMECPLCRTKYKSRTYCQRCEERLVEPQYLAPHAFPRVPVDYAGFGARFGALIVDGLVLLPVTILVYYLQKQSLGAHALGSLISLVVLNVYDIALTATTGQTIGKRAAGIEVRGADGAKMGWGRAFLRRSPMIAYGLVTALTTAAIAAIAGFGATTTEGNLDPAVGGVGAMFLLFSLVFSVYVLGDCIAFFANARHRSLHDFIGGTVVIEK